MNYNESSRVNGIPKRRKNVQQIILTFGEFVLPKNY